MTNARENLLKYINEDDFFNGTAKVESDFDKFCYDHCKDIKMILIENDKLRKENSELNEQNKRLIREYKRRL